jgi:hypothetical protein
MRVYAFPADDQGCGNYRIIWPGNALKDQGIDVEIVPAHGRDNMLSAVMDGDVMRDINIPADADVIVFQRVTHKHIAQAIKLIRARGVAVVVELDDDLTCIDPRNPAYQMLHPKGPWPDHNWQHTLSACKDATLVVSSSKALMQRFGGRLFDNYVPARYLDVKHQDNRLIGWGGSVHSHPGDLQVMGSSINRLVQAGFEIGVIGDGKDVARNWGMPEDKLHISGVVPIDQWPHALSGLGIGVAPLADTKFNAAKSWLKAAEMAAVGVPCVMSPRAEYSRLNGLGVGMLAKDDKDWYRKLKFLAEDDQARLDLSARGRQVMMGMTIEGNAWKLAEIWQDALKLQRAKALGAWSRR